MESTRKRCGCAIAIVALFGALSFSARPTHAGIIDTTINSPTVMVVDGADAPSAFTSTHTGKITFSMPAAGGLMTVARDGGFPIFFNTGGTPQWTAISGEIVFNTGDIVSGNIVVGIANGDTQSVNVLPAGNVLEETNGFIITADITGFFNDDLFATVDTSGFTNPRPGSLILSAFAPGDNPGDTENFGKAFISELDLRLVPEPASLALLALGGLLIARRRPAL